VALAAKSLRRRPGRSGLTVLAVGLAAALLTALLTIASTAQTRVLSELAKGGPLAGIRVAAAAPDPSQVDTDNARPGPPRDIDESARQRIAALADVATVLPVVTTPVFVIPPATAARSGTTGSLQPFGETAVGVDLRRVRQLPITVLAGRLPDPGSFTEIAVTEGYLTRFGLKRQDAKLVLGSELELGAPKAVPNSDGVSVRGRWTRAEIVGVVAQEAGSGQLLAPIERITLDRTWTASGGASDQFDVSTSRYSALFVVARRLDKVNKVRAGITAVGYSTSAPENLIATVQRYLHVVEIVLSGIGLIALVIAALGIANALLAAVRERRREIGVLKAIGARDRDVRRTFLVEAGAVGFVGGVLGSAAGWAIASAVAAVVDGYLTRQGLAGIRLGVPWPVLIGGVIGSTVLALVAGTAPAARAARMPAREAVSGT
jgi:ABC-type antimicrobial peptide transport system permease subunit